MTREELQNRIHEILVSRISAVQNCNDDDPIEIVGIETTTNELFKLFDLLSNSSLPPAEGAEEILPQFGDYCTIEMKRYGTANEHYTHKVIGTLKSNTWVDVPVQSPATETCHDVNELEDVVACVCEGINEREILRYRISDIRNVHNHTALHAQKIADKMVEERMKEELEGLWIYLSINKSKENARIVIKEYLKSRER